MSITIEPRGERVYLLGQTFAVKEQIKQAGGRWDGKERAWWFPIDQAEKVHALARTLCVLPATAAPEAGQNADKIYLTGKGTYKGRTYFLSNVTKDGQRIRCVTLPDAQGKFIDFWVAASQVQIVKTYRQSGRLSGGPMTLGSMARFVGREKDATARGAATCAACGRTGELVVDLEDGQLKHYRCCDIPS